MKIFNKKNITYLTIIFLCIAAAFSQTVDEDEIRSVGGESIRFINYTGPYDRIDSAQSIRDIGGALGDVVAISPTTATQAGVRNRYYLVHSVSAASADGKKRDADILYIGPTAGVDHISNVRRIISGYLNRAYGYSRADADTLAVFATVYNAVYRGNLDAFREKYKDDVIQNLTAENCGLSLSYRDWPGHSEIVIPLYNVERGGLSTIDTTVISDQQVIESMKQEEGKNIDARQQMVDIKERESSESTARAQEAAQQAVVAQREATTERANAQVAQTQAVQAQQQATQALEVAERAQEIALENPDDLEAQKAAEEAIKAAEEAQRLANEAKLRADEAERLAAESQIKADEARRIAALEQTDSDRFQTEAFNDRTDIAKDVQAIINEQAENLRALSVYGLHLMDESRNLSTIVQMNSSNGNLVKQSPVTFIRNRTFYKDTDGFIAIAGEYSGNGTVRIVSIDLDTLTIAKTGAENVAADSVLVKDGSDYYCVIQDNGNYIVAKYDSNLNLKLRSPVYVKESTPITDVGNGTLIVTDANGKPCLLSKADLAKINK